MAPRGVLVSGLDVVRQVRAAQREHVALLHPARDAEELDRLRPCFPEDCAGHPVQAQYLKSRVSPVELGEGGDVPGPDSAVGGVVAEEEDQVVGGGAAHGLRVQGQEGGEAGRQDADGPVDEPALAGDPAAFPVAVLQRREVVQFGHPVMP